MKNTFFFYYTGVSNTDKNEEYVWLLLLQNYDLVKW